jgi:hypothetical protein
VCHAHHDGHPGSIYCYGCCCFGFFRVFEMMQRSLNTDILCYQNFAS